MRFFLPFLFILSSAHALDATELTRFGRAASSSLPDDEIRVLVWNTHGGDGEYFSDDFQDLSRDKHLVILQEANLSDQLRESLLKNKMAYVHAKSFTSPFSGIKMGVATGSVAKDLSSNGFLSPVLELTATTPKVSLFQTYRLSRNKQLLVVNVHAINFTTNGNFAKHIEQISKEMASHGGPILIAGDFNTWNQSRLLMLDTQFSTVGLKRIEFGEGRTQFSVTGSELDQAYSRGLKLEAEEVHTTITSSDHKPLEVHLSVDP